MAPVLAGSREDANEREPLCEETARVRRQSNPSRDSVSQFGQVNPLRYPRCSPTTHR